MNKREQPAFAGCSLRTVGMIERVGSLKSAVIGIGSNSVRMLIAQVQGDTGTRLLREREGTRLFAGLDAEKRLQRDAMDTTVRSVTKMAEIARNDGAGEILLFATSATRDASNQDELRAMLLESAGLELHVCSGEEEASLSFIGATGEGYCGVIDIGGGSTEIVCGEGPSLACAFSCQLGAVRLFREIPVPKTPVPPAVVEGIVERADQILSQKLAQLPPFEMPKTWYGTGGTFTTLGAMVLGVPWTDRTNMHGTRLPLERVEQELAILSSMSVEDRLQLPGLQPNRADIIVHGISILVACMRRLSIPEITVSEFGNLDGFMKKHYQLRTLQSMPLAVDVVS